MNKLKGILLTQGMHGMISQVEGLAKALDIDFTHHTVELNNFWKIVPPKLTPISQSVYKKINLSDFDIIISCGRKSVIPSIHLKNSSKILSKEAILKQLEERIVSCKDVAFKIFGFSLTTFNIIISLIITIVFTKIYLTHENNK